MKSVEDIVSSLCSLMRLDMPSMNCLPNLDEALGICKKTINSKLAELDVPLESMLKCFKKQYIRNTTFPEQVSVIIELAELVQAQVDEERKFKVD